MEGRRTVGGIDWKNGIFGRCVTAPGRTGQLRHRGKRFAFQFGSNLRLRTACCWCDAESRSKMENPDEWYPASYWWQRDPDWARANHPERWGDFYDHHMWRSDAWWQMRDPG